MKKKKRKKLTKAQIHRKFLNEHRYKYEEILAAQGGHCALCPRKPSPNRRLHLDHRHTEPMKIRGVLCFRCNYGLREWMDEDWLKKASKYVKNDL